MAVNRKLTSPEDPKKGGSKAKKGAAAKPKAAKASKPKAAAAKPKAAKAAKPKAAAAKPKAAKGSKSKADKDFDNKRAAHLRKQGKKDKGASLEASLKKRLAVYSAGLKKAKKSQALVRKLMGARQKVARTNLSAKQSAAKTNLLARQKARMAQRLARKPVILKGKITTPKAKPTKVKIVKPTIKPMPHLKDGAIVTTKHKAKKGTSAQKAGAKKAAKTKKKGTVEV